MYRKETKHANMEPSRRVYQPPMKHLQLRVSGCRREMRRGGAAEEAIMLKRVALFIAMAALTIVKPSNAVAQGWGGSWDGWGGNCCERRFIPRPVFCCERPFIPRPVFCCERPFIPRPIFCCEEPR